ncbi:NUDIX hydrolase [Thermolongibacillus altinsuensis]|nr:CoA pyrophosphatase [Thermolongibacillus altinsuensis]
METKKILAKLSNRTPTLLGKEQFTKFAVLLPLIEKDNEIHVLFEVRAFHLRRQPGEICFPGGRIDACDQNEQEAAIRETSEELGIETSKITNIFPLDYIISPFGTIIYPFVAIIAQCTMKPNKEEVAEIFTVPLSFFKQTTPEVYHVHFKAQPEADFPLDKIPNGKNYNWRLREMDEYFYYYKDKVIWGLTARILYHFIEIINQD